MAGILRSAVRRDQAVWVLFKRGREMEEKFVVEETVVRESGESSVCALGEFPEQGLSVTLGITHAMERQSLDVDFLTSPDGKSWAEGPAICFPRKFYCGTYQMSLPPCDARFVKAVWRVNRWGASPRRPFFRFYIATGAATARAMAGGA